MNNHAHEALLHALGLFVSELKSQPLPDLHAVIVRAPINDHPKLFPGAALPPLPVNLRGKKWLDAFFIPLLPASKIHFFGDADRLGRFRDLSRVALSALRQAFPEVDRLYRGILFDGPQGDAEHILADCTLLFLRDIVSSSPSRRFVFDRWYWTGDASNTRIPYHEDDRRASGLTGPVPSEPDVTVFTADVFTFVATALDYAATLTIEATSDQPASTPEPRTAPVTPAHPAPYTRPNPFDAPPPRHDRHFGKINRVSAVIVSNNLDKLIRCCKAWLDLSEVDRRYDPGRIAAAYVKGAAVELKRTLEKVLRLHRRVEYAPKSHYDDLLEMLRGEKVERWPAGLTVEHLKSLNLRRDRLMRDGNRPEPIQPVPAEVLEPSGDRAWSGSFSEALRTHGHDSEDGPRVGTCPECSKPSPLSNGCCVFCGGGPLVVIPPVELFDTSDLAGLERTLYDIELAHEAAGAPKGSWGANYPPGVRREILKRHAAIMKMPEYEELIGYLNIELGKALVSEAIGEMVQRLARKIRQPFETVRRLSIAEALDILTRPEPETLPQVPRSTPKGLSPGAKALAAAYELQRAKQRVSLKAACDRAKVDRKNVREKYPEIVNVIKDLAAPDRTIRRGVRDRRSWGVDAIDDASE